MKRKIIVSACLLGVKCRYDGQEKPCKKIISLVKKEFLLPVCPEQLGGLSTPREPSEISGRKVITKSGRDVSDNFKKGAQEVLRLAKLFGVKEAVFKQKSPSCGCGLIYDGTFSGKTKKWDGITTKLLKKNGIKVRSEEEL